MFNTLNCKVSVLLLLFHASRCCCVLLKKMDKRWLWVTMIILPCLIESTTFAFREPVVEFGDGNKMFLECTFEKSQSVNSPWSLQGSEFIVERFSKFGGGIKKKSSISNFDGSKIGSNDTNNAAKNSTDNACKNSSLGVTHWLILLGLAILAGSVTTLILNLIIIYFAQR
jgi:hypothetical protein